MSWATSTGQKKTREGGAEPFALLSLSWRRVVDLKELCVWWCSASRKGFYLFLCKVFTSFFAMSFSWWMLVSPLPAAAVAVPSRGCSVSDAMAPSVIWDFNVLLRRCLPSCRYCHSLVLKFEKLSRAPGFILKESLIVYARLDACPMPYGLWHVSLLLSWKNNNNWELSGWHKLWMLQKWHALLA